MKSCKQSACSFEQDRLWSVLDLDTLPHILEMAEDNWKLDAATAWSEIRHQSQYGRLTAHRGTGLSTMVDLKQASLDEVAYDYELFLEPTEATIKRLKEIGKETAT